MKNEIKAKNVCNYTLLIIALAFSSYTLLGQDRNVIWVHGINGNKTHWEHYEEIFNNERQINSVNENYDDDRGLDTAAMSVRSYIDWRLSTTSQRMDPRNLAIGHSLGGVVLRNMDRKYPYSYNKRVRGIITFDSPNYGAPIVNSIQDGSVTSAAQNGANKLSKGPSSQFLPFPLNVVGNFYTDDITNALVTDELITGPFGDDVTADELKPNSPEMNAINNYPSTLPRISVWSKENSPVHWNAIATFKNYSSSNYEWAFTLASHVNTTRGVYNGYVIYHASMAAFWASYGIWLPYSWYRVAKHTYRATQWRQGVNWLDNSETIWCSLIKTTRTEPETYYQRIWVPCVYPPHPLAKEPEIIDGVKYIPPDCGRWEWRQFTRTITVNYPSDGLLPQYTQELQGIPSGNRYKIDGANHMELLNMSNSTLNGQPNDGTYERLIEIFNREDWFKTE